MSLTCRCYTGAGIAPLVEQLAHLRIAVFRDWPYLYDGDLDYERRYLTGYAQGDAILVAAFDGARMVGASTGMPIADHSDHLSDALTGFTQDLKSVFYCAESVLLSKFRGQGAYRVFFAEREAHARRLDFTFSAFCAVTRPADHPLRPATHKPLDPVWRRFGYAPLPGVVARMRWRDIGAPSETDKPLQFWGKSL